jgi:cell division protein FtsB
MTGEQFKIISNFEARVRQLMFLCDKLREENVELKNQIAGQKVSNESLSEENKQLKEKYDNLKTARIISVRQGDFAKAKKRVENLIQEINECIALLNK